MCSRTDQYFVDGAQFGGLVDQQSCQLMPWEFIQKYFSLICNNDKLSVDDIKERIDRTFSLPSQDRKDCPICRPIRGRPQSRYQPAQIKPFKVATPNMERYLKLHNGDIYDVDSNSILNRKALYDILHI